MHAMPLACGWGGAKVVYPLAGEHLERSAPITSGTILVHGCQNTRGPSANSKVSRRHPCARPQPGANRAGGHQAPDEGSIGRFGARQGLAGFWLW